MRKFSQSFALCYLSNNDKLNTKPRAHGLSRFGSCARFHALRCTSSDFHSKNKKEYIITFRTHFDILIIQAYTTIWSIILKNIEKKSFKNFCFSRSAEGHWCATLRSVLFWCKQCKGSNCRENKNIIKIEWAEGGGHEYLTRFTLSTRYELCFSRFARR